METLHLIAVRLQKISKTSTFFFKLELLKGISKVKEHYLWLPDQEHSLTKWKVGLDDFVGFLLLDVSY